MKKLTVFGILCLLLSACGVEGDLYLPKKEQQKTETTTHENSAETN